MKKKTLTAFVDWYILNENRLKSNYYSNYFNADRDKFIDAIAEIALEFGIGYGYNPFNIDTLDINKLKNDIANDLKSKKSKSFEDFNNQKSSGVPKALLGKSNYLLFLDFINKDFDIVETTKLEKVESKNIDIKTYLKTDLIKKFTFRLATQDRLYAKLKYPISVIKKMFYNVDRSYFDNWILSQIENIILHTRNAQFKFAQIESLSIMSNGKVVVKDQNMKEYELYTPIAGEDKKVPFIVEGIHDIVIDHVVPFKELFLSERNKFTEIQKIHLGLLIMNDGEDVLNIETLKIAGNLYANSRFADRINYTKLKSQLNYISSKAELQLMDKKQNLYKKKYDFE